MCQCYEKKLICLFTHNFLSKHPNSQQLKQFLTKVSEKFLTTRFLWSSGWRHTSSFSSSDRRIVSPPNLIRLGYTRAISKQSNYFMRLNIHHLCHSFSKGNDILEEITDGRVPGLKLITRALNTRRRYHVNGLRGRCGWLGVSYLTALPPLLDKMRKSRNIIIFIYLILNNFKNSS